MLLGRVLSGYRVMQSQSWTISFCFTGNLRGERREKKKTINVTRVDRKKGGEGESGSEVVVFLQSAFPGSKSMKKTS